MGFDLFMGGLAVVAAALATWLIILYFRSPTSAQSSVETALQGLRNPNSSSAERSGLAANSSPESGQAQSRQTRTAETDGTEVQISRISRMLILAIVLTVIVFIPSLVSRFSASFASTWLVNPWLQAILTTPTMFWCGAPIHREGWHALRRRTPDVNSLISLGATGAFIYSLAICVAGNQFPEGSRRAYFGGVNVIIALALAIELVELLILRDVGESQDMVNAATASQATSAIEKASTVNNSSTAAINKNNKSSESSSSPSQTSGVGSGSNARTIGANANMAAHGIADRAFNTLIAGIRKLAHFTRIFVITVIIIAVWAFALLVVFGPQPRLTFALFGGVGVLVIAGFILAILALVLIVNGRRKAQRGNIKAAE
ncbi:hypothetical protein OZX72_01315 [Bifidobacterium sp. ESL0769]|uniref:hypothetical protein n=1 Tax=Bifidobacterium sp. ESL0769 TaxID=2983229 RepID=UPI0023F6FBFE|nr:hypothetical protein [Bifidobacterium sp. ESL0769]WEV67669.1 hypothetical protein OZX72_01315 [Bifidobacterium sp. ESL0769]